MNTLLSSKRFLPYVSRLMFRIKINLIVLCLIIVSPLYLVAQSPSPPSPGVFTEYDRFKDETTVGVSTTLESYTVEIPSAKMQEFILMAAAFTHPGQRRIVTPKTVRLAFQSQARGWRFSEGAELRGIIDGAIINFGRMSYSRQDLGAGRVEVLRLDIPVPTFLKLARSKTAELRIGNKELRLGPPHLATLAALADQLTDPIIQPKSPASRPTTGDALSRNQRQALATMQQMEQAMPAPSPAATTNGCPIQITQLLPLRGFQLGMSLTEVQSRLQGRPHSISRPDEIGVRSMKVDLSRPQDAHGSTGIKGLAFKFFDDRLYRIEATYSIGKEWDKRPMSEFAESLSRGLGVAASWTIGADKEFKLECGEVRFELAIDDESSALMPSRMKMPMAVAYLKITDTAAERQFKPRREALRLKQQQRDAEKRRVFKP